MSARDRERFGHPAVDRPLEADGTERIDQGGQAGREAIVGDGEDGEHQAA